MRALSLALATLALSPAAAARADGEVEVHLEDAHIERNGPDLLVRCRVRWVNRTRAPLEARTNFASVSDGLTVEIQDLRGRALASEAYVHHQSPYAEDRAIELPPGVTRHELVFPLRAALPARVRVRLVGGLIGSRRHATGLRTRWRVVVVPR